MNAGPWNGSTESSSSSAQARGGLPEGTPEVLRQYLERKPKRPPGEQCEMCSEVIDGEDHSHVADLESRNVMCTCRPCYLLFVPQGAAWGKYRAVPERYLYDPSFKLDEARWNELAIPVGLAFFFYNSQLERTVAFYPSPAGATESLLTLETWQEVMTNNPAFADKEPDVEALLLRRNEIRHGGERGEGFSGYLVPIDKCYELVGLVRQNWKGFDGGEEAWSAIESFFERVRERSKKVGETVDG